MKFARILLYTERRLPLSLTCMHMKGNKNQEDIYDAIEDAKSVEDLTDKLVTIVYDELIEERVTDEYVRYRIIDCYGNLHYLKIIFKPSGRRKFSEL